MRGVKYMGTWGYGLYSDDVTRDVKGIYVDKLRRGKSGGVKRDDSGI